MLVQIDVREDFIHDAHREFGDDGSNDAEHDLLVEITEAIVAAAPTLDVTRAAELHDAEWALQRVHDALVPDADEDLVEAVSILRAMKAYTHEQVSVAANKAADDVLVATQAPDEGMRDAVNLVVNATMHYLDFPEGTLTEAIVAANYAGVEDPADVIEWCGR